MSGASGKQDDHERDAGALIVVRHAGEDDAPALLVVAGEGGAAAGALEIAEHFAERGFSTGVFEVDAGLSAAVHPAGNGAQWALHNALDGRLAARHLDEALFRFAQTVGARDEGLGVCGLGIGGTLALMQACQSDRADALVTISARVVYPDLGRNHPVQPLDLALNLSCPLQGHWGSADPVTPAEDLLLLESRLSQFARSFDIVLQSEAGYGWPTFSESAREGALQACGAFLQEVLEP